MWLKSRRAEAAFINNNGMKNKVAVDRRAVAGSEGTGVRQAALPMRVRASPHAATRAHLPY